MDWNCDGKHDYQDDAIFHIIIDHSSSSRSSKKYSSPSSGGGDDSGMGCGVVALIFALIVLIYLLKIIFS